MTEASGGRSAPKSSPLRATTPAAAVSAVVGLATQRLVGRRISLEGPESTVQATIGAIEATPAGGDLLAQGYAEGKALIDRVGAELRDPSIWSPLKLSMEAVSAAARQVERAAAPLAHADVAATLVDDFAITAKDVTWDDRRIDTVELRDGSLTYRPGLPAEVIAHHVDVTATIDQDSLDLWLVALDVDFEVTLAEEGVVSVTGGRFRRFGQVIVRPTVATDVEPAEGETTAVPKVKLNVEAVVAGGRRIRPPKKLRDRWELDLPMFAEGVRLVSVTPEADQLVVKAHVERWSEAVTPDLLDAAVSQMSQPAGAAVELRRVMLGR